MVERELEGTILALARSADSIDISILTRNAAVLVLTPHPDDEIARMRSGNRRSVRQRRRDRRRLPHGWIAFPSQLVVLSAGKARCIAARGAGERCRHPERWEGDDGCTPRSGPGRNEEIPGREASARSAGRTHPISRYR